MKLKSCVCDFSSENRRKKQEWGKKIGVIEERQKRSLTERIFLLYFYSFCALKEHVVNPKRTVVTSISRFEQFSKKVIIIFNNLIAFREETDTLV